MFKSKRVSVDKDSHNLRFVQNVKLGNAGSVQWDDGPAEGPSSSRLQEPRDEGGSGARDVKRSAARARWQRAGGASRAGTRTRTVTTISDAVLSVQRRLRVQNISLTVAIAPIFGFFGRVGTNFWHSVCLLVTVVAYICFGAYMFEKYETGEAFFKITDAKILRKEMLRYFLMDEHEGYNGSYWTEREWNVLYEISKGRCFKADAKDAKYHFWNFWTSMDFASTILTTIGYGGMVPHTMLGKLLVIVYALPGMLLMMSYLNLFSVCILLIIRKMLKLIERVINFLRRSPGSAVRKSLTSFAVSIILTVISLAMLTIYLIIMSSVLANSNENDTFLKSLYFYVITMTTVGLGDIAVIDHLWYGVTIKVLCVFCIGLALVTTVFGAVRGLAEANRKRVVKATKMLAEKAAAKKVDLREKLKMKQGDYKLHHDENLPESQQLISNSNL